MQPASFGAKASARRPRLARSKVMEETMGLLMRSELMRATGSELVEWFRRISDSLPELPEGSRERDDALANLDNICREQCRRALALRGFSR
jgi:predicted component of type VI protein secretion system